MAARIKSKYRGVYYREIPRVGGHGTERIYYIIFKKDGRTIEEKVGSQFRDNMTPAKASGIRAERIENRRKSRKEIKQEAYAKKQAEHNKWTIDKLWNEYKNTHPGLKGIVQDENRFKNYIIPQFGNKTPKEIISLDLKRIELNLTKTKSTGTAKNVLELIRRIINFGIKNHLCEPPGFTVSIPRPNNLKTEDLTPTQLKKLLDAIAQDHDVQVRNLMRMALYTGMRRGELFRLKWADIDFNRGFINLRDPKGGIDQKIPLNDAAREILKKHPRTGSSYVFPGRKGDQRVDINHQVNRIKKRANLPKDFRALHGLRHVYASMLASSGQVDMYTLQKLLTHKSPQMTQRYAHLRDDSLKNASNLAGKLIKSAI